MKWLIKKLLTFFKAKYWGVGYDLDIPPEFIIGKHAKQRLDERIPNGNHEELVIDAWAMGGPPPIDFKPDLARQPRLSKTFKVIYKSYGGYVWVFAKHYNRRLDFAEKHLITIYYEMTDGRINPY